MTVITTKVCDRCNKEPINNEYTLSVGVSEELPQHGGWSTGHELREVFHFCQKCKSEIIKDLLEFLRHEVVQEQTEKAPGGPEAGG